MQPRLSDKRFSDAKTEGSHLRLEPFLGEETDGTLSLFEALFSSGITIDSIGKNDSFLLFRQPFIGGRHPTETELHDHMRDLGWAPLNAPCIGDTLKNSPGRKAVSSLPTSARKTPSSPRPPARSTP